MASAIAVAHDRGLARSRDAYRPLVVGYHRIVEDFSSEANVEMPSMLTSRTMFERHLDCLGKSFRFVSLDEIGDRLLNGLPFHEPVAAITFDDGYRDVYELALPILERKGIPYAYLAFEGEGHGFRKQENVRRSLEATLSFIGQVFGFVPADELEPLELMPVR